jgi:hypothetical protein
MALVYEATLTPSKLELLETWLPTRSWFHHDGELVRIGSYRFDDPAGAVGIEVMLVSSGVTVFQIPLTYRGAPLDNASTSLVGTMVHSVLGPRWIYDGCGDPVAVAALLTATLCGTSEAAVEIEVDGQMVALPSAIAVRGSGHGSPDAVSLSDVVAGHDDDARTRITTSSYRIDVARVVGADVAAPFVLTGSWAGQPSATLVGVTHR